MYVFHESIWDYIFDCIIINILFYTAFSQLYKSKTNSKFIWFWCFIFCLFAFWDSDYYSFRYWFYHWNSKDSFRDVLYPILHPFAYGNYTLYRLYIWGTGIICVGKTIMRFKLNINIGAAVFALFFLMTYSYARASLGMSFFFLGLSYILVKDGSIKKRILWSVLFLILAFCAHRSMGVLIILIPFILLPLNRNILIILILLVPVVSSYVNAILEYIGDLQTENSTLQSAASSALGYGGLKHDISLNWKFLAITWLRNLSLYLAIIFTYWKLCIVPKIYKNVAIDRLASYCLGLLWFASVLFFSGKDDNWGDFIMGYRFLYATGVGGTILLAYAYQNQLLNKRDFWLLMGMAMLYSESFLIGKIFSLVYK